MREAQNKSSMVLNRRDSNNASFGRLPEANAENFAMIRGGTVLKDRSKMHRKSNEKIETSTDLGFDPRPTDTATIR